MFYPMCLREFPKHRCAVDFPSSSQTEGTMSIDHVYIDLAFHPSTRNPAEAAFK